MGDLCLMLSVVESLKAIRPGMECWCLPLSPGGRDACEVAVGRSAIDRMLDWRDLSYERVMSRCGPEPRAELVELLKRAALVVAYAPDTECEREWLRIYAGERLGIVDTRIPVAKQRGRHLTDYARDVLARQGHQSAATNPPCIDLERFNNPDSPWPRPICLAPGAGDPRKAWPMEGWETLANFYAASGRPVVWAVGPTELRNPLYARIRCRPERIIVAGNLWMRLREIAGYARLIGSDSGLTHMAAACGIPVTVVYTPAGEFMSGPEFWRPLGPHVRLVRPPSIVPDWRTLIDALRPEPNSDATEPVCRVTELELSFNRD